MSARILPAADGTAWTVCGRRARGDGGAEGSHTYSHTLALFSVECPNLLPHSGPLLCRVWEESEVNHIHSHTLAVSSEDQISHSDDQSSTLAISSDD